MTINVYWACLENEWMLAEEPEPVANIFYKKNIEHDYDLKKCPAFKDNLKNVFALKSIYDYEFYVSEERVYSDQSTQEFFDNHVVIRSLQQRLFSFMHSYIFFTDEESLLTTINEFPFLEDNNVSSRCIIISGQFDIGKWFRNSELPFYLKPNQESFKIEKEEIYSYVRFHTKEKILFKQFRYTKDLHEYKNDGFLLNTKVSSLKKMENYYKNFKNKKLILKEIKKNII